MSKIHLPGLTEIRGIAALCVVFGHLDQLSDHLQINHTGLHETGIAGYAVTIFFTLSGFLITFLALRERNEFGKVAIQKFYLRRILRIWPAYYLTIFISLFAIMLGIYSAPAPRVMMLAVASYIFFMPNLGYVMGWLFSGTNPLWSIGVEEQFYLVWPWVINKIKKLEIFLISVIIVLPLLRLVIFFIHPAGGLYALLKLTQFDCMAIGAIGIIWYQKYPQIFGKIVFHKAVQVLAILILIMPFFTPFNWIADVDIELYSLASFVWIANSALNGHAIILVKSTMLQFFGKISYGLYVYHWLIIYLIGRYTTGLPVYIQYPLLLMAVVLWSAFSYFKIERWFLSLKKRYTVVESAS